MTNPTLITQNRTSSPATLPGSSGQRGTVSLASSALFSLCLWLGALSGLLASLGGGVMHQSFGGYAQALTGPENQYLSALAAHLNQSGAHFYGASWCPHCQHQKALFGPAWIKLPYVECSPHGPGTPQATDCMTANISTYPTWVIREKPRAKILTIQELATLSGFKPPAPVAQSR